MSKLFSEKELFESEIMLQSIREELDDHLEAINENTAEIQSNYEYIKEIDDKIAKLNEKIDEIQHFLKKLGAQFHEFEHENKLETLTEAEQRLFLAIYTEEGGTLSYLDLSRKLNLPLPLVREYISSMIEKGVKIKKLYLSGKPYLQLDEEFRDRQAKYNILKINQKTLI
ncbi:MAG: winged helix-turn-helix transcriptional regulator [Candidatus Woesearchaeota archaeon]